MSALQLSSIISGSHSSVEAIEAVLKKNDISYETNVGFKLAKLDVDPSVRLNYQAVGRMTEIMADASTANKILLEHPILAFGNKERAYVFVGAMELSGIKEGWEKFKITTSYLLKEEPSQPLKLLLSALAKNKKETVPRSYNLVDWVSNFNFHFPFPFHTFHL